MVEPSSSVQVSTTGPDSCGLIRIDDASGRDAGSASMSGAAADAERLVPVTGAMILAMDAEVYRQASALQNHALIATSGVGASA